MSGYRGALRRRNLADGRMEEDPWVPVIQDTHLLQDIERRRATDIQKHTDPHVVVSMSPDVKFASPPPSLRVVDLFHRQLAVNAISCGYEVLRQVQSSSYPYLKKGCDLALLTPGGTGKTTAYLLPLIQKVVDDLRVRPHRSCHPRAVILVSTKEHAKYLLDKCIALTDGLGINSSMLVSQMTPSAFTLRDSADIFITTPFLFLTNLNENRVTMAYVNYLVFEGLDDYLKEWSFRPESVRQIFAYYDDLHTNCQLVLVGDDKTAIDEPFWNDRIYSGNNTAILEGQPHQKMSPANHLLVRARGHQMPEAVLETIKHYGGGSALVVVPDRLHDIPQVIKDMLHLLKENNFPAEYYHTQLSMPKREALLRNFTMGNFKVLITKYCCQMRHLRFPALRQVIHIGSPYRPDESYATSYHFASSVVAYMPHARSVVLVNVDHSKQSGKNMKDIVEVITESTKDVEWKTYRAPMWTLRHFEDERCSWSSQDCKDADNLADLKTADPTDTGGKAKNEKSDEGEADKFQESLRPQIPPLDSRGNSPFDFRPDEWSPPEGAKSRQEMGRRDHAYVKKEEHYSSSDESYHPAERKRNVSGFTDGNEVVGNKEMVFHRRDSGRQRDYRGQLTEAARGQPRREEPYRDGRRDAPPRREEYGNGSRRQMFDSRNDEPRRVDRRGSPPRHYYGRQETRRYYPSDHADRSPPRRYQDDYDRHRDYDPPRRDSRAAPSRSRNDFAAHDMRYSRDEPRDYGRQEYGRMERRERPPELFQRRPRQNDYPPPMDRRRETEDLRRNYDEPVRFSNYDHGRPSENRMVRDFGRMSMRDRRPEPPRQEGYRNDSRRVQRVASREDVDGVSFGNGSMFAGRGSLNYRGFEDRRQRSPPRREVRSTWEPRNNESWDQFANRGKQTENYPHSTHPRRQSSPRKESQRNVGSHRYSENRRGGTTYNSQSSYQRPPSAAPSSSVIAHPPAVSRPKSYRPACEEDAFVMHPCFAERGGRPLREDVMRNVKEKRRCQAAEREIAGPRRDSGSEDDFKW